MKHVIIGTAGHIDHGKTALLKALTGVDADRLPEERERGLTIDLGYVFYNSRVSIVDVPGHEKFIKNMLAGATTIDFAILVIAADDGIMPQTREHLDILQLLGVRRGIIALTKTDLVEPEWLELVRSEIAGLVGGTFLEEAPVLAVSSVTGEGVDRLRTELEREIEATPLRRDKGIFRYWIDRSFVLTGVGNVVTGTVLSGRIAAGDTLELLPQGRKVRARKLQSHNEEVGSCVPGQRAAINLVGIDSGEVVRGDLLATPGYFRPAYMVNARLELLGSAPPLKNRARIRFHAGCRELLARVVLLDRETLAPGGSTVAQFRLEEPMALDIGDRYIIRRYSPPRTIGGGTVIDVDTPKLKYLPDDEIRRLMSIQDDDTGELLLHVVMKDPLRPHTSESLARELATARNLVDAALESLIDDGKLVRISGKKLSAVVPAGELELARERVTGELRKFHTAHPNLKGIKRSELYNKLFGALDQAVFEAILEPLVSRGELVADGELLYLAGHAVTFAGADARLAEKIEGFFREAGWATPSVRDVAESLPDTKLAKVEEIVRGLVELGRLVEIRAEADQRVLFHCEAVERAGKVLVDLLRQNGEIRVTDYRRALNASRKYATPLLVYFDQQGLTVREGDMRRLK